MTLVEPNVDRRGHLDIGFDKFLYFPGNDVETEICGSYYQWMKLNKRLIK